VLHGMPANLLTPQPVKQEYAAFLGRISPEKGVDKAIRIAGRAGMKLKIAAKVDNADKEYYDTQIKPLIQANPFVEFIGEINDQQKPAFLSGAHALIFPIDWPEPFGLVMIEAMACGTPVIAYRSGSVPEVIDDGVSGFLMVWLYKPSSRQPIGSVARTASIAGHTWNVWVGPRGSTTTGTGSASRPVISYVAQDSPVSSLSFDLKAFISDAVSHADTNNGVSGPFASSWYLTDVFAGFEIWTGSDATNLTSTGFQIAVK